jgi:hypothetical protein
MNWCRVELSTLMYLLGWYRSGFQWISRPGIQNSYQQLERRVFSDWRSWTEDLNSAAGWWPTNRHGKLKLRLDTMVCFSFVACVRIMSKRISRVGIFLGCINNYIALWFEYGMKSSHLSKGECLADYLLCKCPQPLGICLQGINWMVNQWEAFNTHRIRAMGRNELIGDNAIVKIGTRGLCIATILIRIQRDSYRIEDSTHR